jgi:hexosaminidase
MMKRFLFTTIFMVGICTASWCQDVCPVIPLPAAASKTSGSFLLNAATPVQADAALQPVAYYLQKELLRLKNLSLSRQSKAAVPAITLMLSSKGKAAPESYTLAIKPEGIVISAPDEAGAFYGVISLLQMVQQSQTSGGNIALPCWQIQDAPLYAWRGLMLDESRHFFGKEKVKFLLNWMAFYKLNRFHWHLTDEPAWRLEIKRYPKLALVGGIGNYLDSTAPAKYYTQEDIKEIVAYAAERKITVIPEIDMPGHATAANKAYPQFSGGGSEKHPDFTFHPGKEATYQYLTDILRETDVLFPSEMMHLGGDEVSFGNEKWRADPEVQSLMREKSLKDVKAVEEYFMQRMADSLFGMNNKFLAWDEMAGMSLPVDKTIIFWWRHDQPAQLKKALDKGYTTVLCPRLPLYFDFVQDSLHRVGRKWNKLYNALEQVYNFSAEQFPVAQNKKSLIAGIQANLWTETVATEQRLEYLLFPRISALAEAAWSEKKDYTNYMQRVKQHLPLYQKEKIYYYDPFRPAQHPEPVLLK